MTELAEGGRVEGEIRSKVLVVREGALFSGQSSMDTESASDEADGSAYPADDLQMAYAEAVRRAADWYRSRLYGSEAEPDQQGGPESDAPAVSDQDETTSDQGERSRPSRGLPRHQRVAGRGETRKSIKRPPKVRTSPKGRAAGVARVPPAREHLGTEGDGEPTER